MNGAEMKAIREGLGLRQQDLADKLKLGSDGGRTVRRWERGESPISGPVEFCMVALKSGYKPKPPPKDQGTS